MAGDYETDVVLRIETNLDDCSGEILGVTMERLFAAGALDVWFTPIQMKKHRPGLLLSALCEEAARETLVGIILTETSAFGVRVEKIERMKLARRFVKVRTEFGDIEVKLGLKGGRVVQVAPEFESVRRAAEASGQPLQRVHDAAMREWKE